MAGDAFKNVQPGQRLEITTEAYNAFLDIARAAQEHKQFRTDTLQFFRQSGIVKVTNASGSKARTDAPTEVGPSPSHSPRRQQTS